MWAQAVLVRAVLRVGAQLFLLPLIVIRESFRPKAAQVKPAPHEPATDGLHVVEHQLLPEPLVRQCPVTQSAPVVQNRHRSDTPTCGRHAKPAVDA